MPSAKFGWNWPTQLVLGKTIFKCWLLIFAILLFISPWRRTWSFVWKKNLNSHRRGMFCGKSGCEISPMALRIGIKVFLTSMNYFAIFFSLIRVWFCESSSPKNALCQVWLKFTLGFWKRFSNVIALRKKAWSFIWTKFSSPLPKNVLYEF